MSHRLFFASLLFSTISLFAFLVLGLALPYVGPNATNNNLYALIARNYNRYGFRETGFTPIVSVGYTLPADPEYYFHHPPLPSILIAIFFRLFGDGFAQGRLISIFFCLGSYALMIWIARRIGTLYLAGWVAIALSVLPMFVVFGKLIGFEPLVLFFWLLSAVLFLKPKSWTPFVFVITCVLAVLSGWAGTYAIAALLPLAIATKQKKLWILGIVTVTLTALSVIGWTAWVMGGLSDLLGAIHNRSLGYLLTLSWWPLRWVSVISLRFFLYGTPFFFLGFLVWVLHLYKRRNWNLLDAFIFSSLLFSGAHIVLFPEGSFGHPYWMFYGTPAVVFVIARTFSGIQKKIVLFGLLLFFVLWSVFVVSWKHKQVLGQVFRYTLGETVNRHLPPMAAIRINDDGVTDRDLYEYAFNKPAIPLSFEKQGRDLYLVYSCRTCSMNDETFRSYVRSYSSKYIQTPDAEAYLFYLQACGVTSLSASQSIESSEIPPTSSSLPKRIVQSITSWLSVPQL